MAAPTIVSYTQTGNTQTAFGNTGLSTANVAVLAGDKVVIAGGAEDSAHYGTITLSLTGGLTGALTVHQSDQTTSYAPVAIASADVTASGNLQGHIVGTGNTTSVHQNVGVWVLRSHNGVGVTGKAHQAAGSLPSLTLAGASADSVLVCFLSDWAATGGTGPTANPTYRQVDAANPTQRYSFTDGSTWHNDVFDYVTTSAGSKTVGETVPTGQTPNLVAVEVLASAVVADNTTKPALAGMFTPQLRQDGWF